MACRPGSARRHQKRTPRLTASPSRAILADRLLLTQRTASPADIPALVALINRAYRVEQFFIRGERTSAAEAAALIAAEEGAFLVLEAGTPAALRGAVYVKVNGTTGYLGFLSVDPDYQGQGMGKQLLHAVEAFCARAGCGVVELDVFNVREELHPFYRSAGYSEIGTAPFAQADLLLRPAHLIRMAKRLTSVPDRE